MAQPSRASFEKRRRERAKRQKRLDKIARRQERKAKRQSGEVEDDTHPPEPDDSGQE
jgi:hypothetical protein